MARGGSFPPVPPVDETLITKLAIWTVLLLSYAIHLTENCPDKTEGLTKWKVRLAFRKLRQLSGIYELISP